MRKIVCFSGGKDSTAMLLLMIEKGISFNEIVYFNSGAWEFPEMKKHVFHVEKYIQKKITQLAPTKSFSYWFWQHWPNRKHHQPGLGKSWPTAVVKWCKRVKCDTMDKYCKDSLRYIGFAHDEQKRCNTKNMQKLNVKFPLIDMEITEQQALQICYDHGFLWGGLYEHFDRASCWCCPYQPLKSLRSLWKYFPRLWQKLELMDAATWQQFRKDYSVQDLTIRFKKEEYEK